MDARRWEHHVFVAALFAGCFLRTAWGSPLRYNVTDLGNYRAAHLNNAGQVVGTYNPPGLPLRDGFQPPQAFRYNSYGPKAGQIEDVGGPDSIGRGINDTGVVVGSHGERGEGPFVSDGATATPLHAIPLRVSGQANSINNSGEIVGTGFVTSDGKDSGLAVYRNGNVTPLLLPADAQTGAGVINNVGQVAGWVFGVDANGTNRIERAVIWDKNGQPINLGGPSNSLSQATDINDAGTVVGWSDSRTGLPHAAVWMNRVLRDMGTLGGRQSGLLGINSLGEMVGSSTTASGVTHGLLIRDGSLLDLNNFIGKNLGLTLVQARDINDVGQILADASDASGKSHSILLTPDDLPIPATPIQTPEPTTLVVLTIGLCGLAFLRRTHRFE